MIIASFFLIQLIARPQKPHDLSCVTLFSAFVTWGDIIGCNSPFDASPPINPRLAMNEVEQNFSAKWHYTCFAPCVMRTPRENLLDKESSSFLLLHLLDKWSSSSAKQYVKIVGAAGFVGGALFTGDQCQHISRLLFIHQGFDTKYTSTKLLL